MDRPQERVHELAEHFRSVHDQRMRGMPIVNENLDVEAVGFKPFDDHLLGVLITPWFMNLVVLPGDDQWADAAQGAEVELTLPHGDYAFTVNRDGEFGVFLSAVLFRTVMDFPDNETARAVAEEVLRELFAAEGPAEPEGKDRVVSRRDLLTALGSF